MITNEKQYKITRASLREFDEALEKTRSSEEQEQQDPILRQAEIESLESERKVLREQLEEYEAVRDGQVPSLTVSLDRLGEALALARVAAGLTQAQLAERDSAPHARAFSLDGDRSRRDQPDRQRIEPVLFDEDPRRQQINRVVVPHRHGRLQHDRASVEFARHDVHRRARYLDAVLERLTLRVDTGERG